jgi:competence protein ComEA
MRTRNQYRIRVRSRTTVRSTLFVVGLFCAVLALTIAAATQYRFPEAPGKAELLKVCGGCHGAETVLAHAQTADGWAETLGRMVQLGAEGTQEEWRLVQKYLDSQLAMIAINRAAADEIQRTVDVPDAVAQAIVTYRREHGNFKSIDDLKNVPGLDTAKVDDRSDRLIF